MVLKQLLKERHLHVSGNKKQLVDRLLEDNKKKSQTDHQSIPLSEPLGEYALQPSILKPQTTTSNTTYNPSTTPDSSINSSSTNIEFDSNTNSTYITTPTTANYTITYTKPTKVYNHFRHLSLYPINYHQQHNNYRNYLHLNPLI